MNHIIDKVFTAINPTVTDLGYEIVDIEYAVKYSQKHLTVFIDIPRGITLDDCEKVHLAIDPVIEQLNPTADAAYVLNVSSPGLDRPFRKQRDFERNYNREVEVKLYAPLKGKKIIEGVLLVREEHTTTIKTAKEDLKLENSKIAKVSQLIKFQ